MISLKISEKVDIKNDENKKVAKRPAKDVDTDRYETIRLNHQNLVIIVQPVPNIDYLQKFQFMIKKLSNLCNWPNNLIFGLSKNSIYLTSYF